MTPLVIPSAARKLHVTKRKCGSLVASLLGMTSPLFLGTTSPLFLTLILVSLGGCIHGKLPPREFYRLRLPPLPDSLGSYYRDGGSANLVEGLQQLFAIQCPSHEAPD